MQGILERAIAYALKEMGIEDALFVVEHPADYSHGEYATNAALLCAKELGKAPREVAERLRELLQSAQIPNLAQIEIAGPGFINFRLKRDFFSESLMEATEKGDAYGTNDSLKGAVILFEYTSPNLFKPLHVGNLVGNIVGESVSRLLEASGAQVKRINYPSDIGLTVAKGVWGLRKTGNDPKDIEALGEAYRVGNEAYEHDAEAKLAIEEVNRALYAGSDASLNVLREAGLETSHAHLTELCRMLGTSFDAEIRESEASNVGESLVREHIGDVFEESEGAVVFKGEKYGLHTRVFLNSQGLPTYEAKDVGNFHLKQKKYPEWTESYVVTGNEQREYFKVLFEAIKKVFPDAEAKTIGHIATGFLTLTTGKMSSRKGNVLTGESIIALLKEESVKRAEESRAEDIESLGEQVAVGALKYQILRQAPGQDIVFDKERALALEGDSGPYLMYTYARTVSLEERGKSEGIGFSGPAPAAPYAVEKLVYRFPEVVKQAEASRAPHHLVVYLTELAGAFNSFYAEEKIVDRGDTHAPYKLLLTKSVQHILRNGIRLLGIPTPQKM